MKLGAFKLGSACTAPPPCAAPRGASPYCKGAKLAKTRLKLKALLSPFHNQTLKPGAFKLGLSLRRPRRAVPPLHSVIQAPQTALDVPLRRVAVHVRHVERQAPHLRRPRRRKVRRHPPGCSGASSEIRFKVKALYALSGSRVESRALSSQGRACTALPGPAAATATAAAAGLPALPLRPRRGHIEQFHMYGYMTTIMSISLLVNFHLK